MAHFLNLLKLNINLNIYIMNVKPLADRVLVEPAQAETTTASGIIIPDTAQEKPQKGTIIAVGDGKKDEPLTVKSWRYCTIRQIFWDRIKIRR